MLGTQIKAARKSVGMTQGDLADKVGICRSHIGAIEHGRYKPSFETVLKIANVTGKPIIFFTK